MILIRAMPVIAMAWLADMSVGQAEPAAIRPVRLSGRVTDSNGTALRHANVTLTVAGFIGPAASADTDDDGAFAFPAVPPNIYQVDFYVEGFLPRVRTVTARKDIDIGSVAMDVALIEDTRGPATYPSHLPTSLHPEKAMPRRISSSNVRSVCDVLRQLKKLNGQMVSVHGDFRYLRGHGAWLLDQESKEQPCEKIPTETQIWRFAIWLDSTNNRNLDGGPVDFRQEPPTLDDLIIRQQELEPGAGRGLLTTLTGELRTRNRLTIVPAESGSGDTMGNGYGIGGAFSAVLVVKTVRNIQIQ